MIYNDIGLYSHLFLQETTVITSDNTKRNLFPYFGEEVIAEILRNEKKAMANLANAIGIDDPDIFQVIGPGEVTLFLNPPRLDFDPYQRLDLALLRLDTSELIPVEIKLGYTPLSDQRRIDWLRPCQRQNGSQSKLKGNMLAVLNRSFEEIEDEDELHLYGKFDAREFPVTKEWALIVRDKIIASYEKCNFKQCRLIKLKQHLLDGIHSERFDEIVGNMLKNTNFYETWIE